MPDTWTNCNSILFDLIYLPLQRDGSSISLCMSHAILSSDGARCLISNQLKSVPHNLFLHTHLPRLPQCQQFLDIFTLGFASWLRPAHTKENKNSHVTITNHLDPVAFSSSKCSKTEPRKDKAFVCKPIKLEAILFYTDYLQAVPNNRCA